MAEWTLPPEVASIPLARRLATKALTDVPKPTRDAVALVVSELATNCVRHAQTEFRLKVIRGLDYVRIEVTDRGGGRPTAQSPPPSVAHGRGLQIVQRLAERWGVEHSGSGKTVWCIVAA